MCIIGLKRACLAESAGASQAGPYTLNCHHPIPPQCMAGVQDFVAGLALAGKGVKEDQKTVKVAIGDQALKKTQI